MNNYFRSLKPPIGIVGMGKSGSSVLQLLMATKLYDSEQIVTFDQSPGKAKYHNLDLFLKEVKPQTLVVSPGIDLRNPALIAYKEAGGAITSEINLASSFLTTEKLIGITGSVGKSTVTSLLGAGLSAFSKNFFVGGNLGVPFANYAFDLVSRKRAPADWVILELSSFQLENSSLLNLDYSGITYLSKNHLERYNSLQDYFETKWSILEKTAHKTLINAHSEDLVNFHKSRPSTKITLSSKQDLALQNFKLNSCALLGAHNQENLALAANLALQAGWPDEAIQNMKQFPGLPHRLENCGTYQNIRFINDSKATAIESVLMAVSTCSDFLPSNQSLHLLLGGKDKNLPWEKLQTLKDRKDLKFYFFGSVREHAQNTSQLSGVTCTTMKDLMHELPKHIQSGDIVLLSPGGTSLDEFSSFEERGDFFRKSVQDYFSI